MAVALQQKDLSIGIHHMKDIMVRILLLVLRLEPWITIPETFGTMVHIPIRVGIAIPRLLLCQFQPILKCRFTNIRTTLPEVV